MWLKPKYYTGLRIRKIAQNVPYITNIQYQFTNEENGMT